MTNPAHVTHEQALAALGRLAGVAGLEGSADAQLVEDALAQARPVQGPRVGVEAALGVALAGLEAKLGALCQRGNGTPAWQWDLFASIEALIERVEAVRRGDVAADEPWGEA